MPNPIISLSFNEVARAPEAVGIYAWYGVLYAPLADYKRDVDEGGSDLGALRFRAVLAKHLARYRLAPLRISGRGSFGVDWKGALEDRAHERQQELVLGQVAPSAEGEEDDGFSTSVANATREERGRRLLSRTLAAATPFLEAPIYIGMTDNLKRRLDQHVRRYRTIREAVASDEAKLAAVKDRARSGRAHFALRAVAMDFAPEHLKVYALNIDDLSDDAAVSPDQLRDVAVTAEWILNRSHRPLAGRR